MVLCFCTCDAVHLCPLYFSCVSNRLHRFFIFCKKFKMFVFHSPSILGPDFLFRLPVMADTVTVTLGLIGWASVSMTTTIWAVWRETLWKDSALAPGAPGAPRALTLLTLPRAWWCGSEREGKALGSVFAGEEWGVEEADGGLLEVSHVWFGRILFR